MRYFDAMKSKPCPASLTARETQHKTCNQRKNAIAWANKSVWVHHNLLQILPYYMLYFKTTLLSGQLANSRGRPLNRGLAVLRIQKLQKLPESRSLKFQDL